ncbi:MAG TPA: DMT family transporter [Anaerovoracaceae bacterium]|nr:DMT family transporter [Anaerovoracaceae bacterium]
MTKVTEQKSLSETLKSKAAAVTAKQKGILLMLLSAFLFAAMQVCIMITGDTVPLMEQVFFRNFVSVVICFVIIRRNGLSMFGGVKDQPLLFMRSAFGLFGLLTYFYAASRASQADVAILTKLSAFLITLFAFLFLKEKIARIQVPALIIAFGGAFIVANPSFHSDLFPLFMAILCSIFSSVAYTLLAYSKDKVNAVTIIMHFATFCSVVSLPFFIMDMSWPGMKNALLLLVIGVFGGFGQIALTYSYRMAPASEVSIYNYSGILFSMILGYFALGETVPYNSLIGGALVILASFLAYRYSNHPVE